ncbi:MAG: ComEC/Rec2 family competence protein [Candidatus Omnitrophica bacterium]|nr:ComEC/Rec2 family competence protein [Candidatus Omnitrophota bacterium]
MKHSIVIITGLFILGIIAARCVNVPFIVLFLPALMIGVISVAMLKRERMFSVFMVFFIFFLGAVYCKNSRSLQNSHIAVQFPYGTKGLCALEGDAVSHSQAVNNRTVFRLRTEAIETDGFRRFCSGEVLVSVKGAREIKSGRRLRLTGELIERNDELVMKVAFPSRVQEIGKPRIFFVRAFAGRIKEACERIIFEHMPPGAAGIVDAMVLGEKKHVSPIIYRSMMKTGTVHILVVSGFNAGIVAFMVMLLLKVLRVPKMPRIILTVPILIVYCFMTGASAPVVRATVMAVFMLTALLFQREPDIFNALAAAGLGILLFDPNQLFEISFQLSFVSVMALVYLYPRLRTAFCLTKIKIGFARVLAEAFTTSFSAWAGTMGLIAYYFKTFSPVTVFANILIVPIASFITLCGFSLLAVNYVFPPWASSVASACEWAVNLLLYINSVLVRIPGAYFSL